MRHLLALLLAITLFALPAASQAQDDDGEGYLTRLLQDTLSGAGRSVDIQGFRGALSSRATLDKLTIADDEGIWLEMTNAVLDWNRSALLRGRLEVGELSAESLTVSRIPKGEESDAEASGFAIPELPVSVDVEKVTIGTIDLGESLLGETAQFTFDGKARLDDQALDTTLSLVRLDKEGEIGLVLDLRPDENTLVLEVAAEEAENGIAARILNLPTRPAISLNIDGNGPLDDFRANVRLASDGTERLAGTVSLKGQTEEGREFAADIGGDLTALLLPQAREFLGDDVRLVVSGERSDAGGLRLDTLSLKAAAVALNGSLEVRADGRPARFDLNGRIRAPDGEDVVLPFGTDVVVSDATITATFDADESEDVTAEVTLDGFSQPAVAIAEATLGLRGVIVTDGLPAVDLKVTSALEGVNFTDEGLQEAVGRELAANARIRWTSGEDVTLDNLELRGTEYSAQVDATLTPGGGTTILTADGKASLQDLTRFVTLSGTDMEGQADLAFDLSTDLLGGSFAVSAKGSTTDLALGIEQLDPVIGGNAALDLSVSRGPEGIVLDQFRLANTQLALQAAGEIDDDSGRVNYGVSLVNSGAFTGADGGPIDLAGVVTRTGETFVVTLDGGGQDLAVGIPQVDALLEGATELSAQLTLNDRILLDRAQLKTPALDISAEGELTAGARQVTLRGDLFDSGIVTGTDGGPLNLTVTAVETDEVYDVTLDGTGRNLAIGVDQVDALLAGQTDLSARVLIAGEQITLDRLAVSNPALSAEGEGDLTEGRRDVRLTARLADSGRPLGGSGGPLDLTARATQDGEGYLLELDATGQNIGTGQALADSLLAGTTQISARGRVEDSRLRLDSASVDGRSVTARASGVVASGATDLDFSARLASLAAVVPEAPAGPLTASGSVRQATGGALALNISADGPGGTTAQVSGQVGLPGGAVDLDISGNAPLALANPYIAPRSISGTANFDLAMNGQPGLSALNGRVTFANGRAVDPSVALSVETINGGVTLSGGRANVDVTAALNGGLVSVRGPVTLSAPFNADLTATLDNIPFEKPGLVTTRADGRVTITGGLTGGALIAGRVGVSDTELRIPAGGFGGVEAIPEMRHVNEDAASRTTRARAGLIGEGAAGGAVEGASSGGLRLNLRVEVDTPIYLRGRGIDAELRGGLTLEGTTNDVRPVGQFDLVRGRIDVLTKRLELTEGRIRLAGGFDPIIRLVAESQAGEFTVQIIIDGPAGQPEVIFTSRPELPEDEVLSQLFFERDISSLTPFQAARLALAIAELTGNGNGGVVGKLREGAGLDDLDVSQTEDGETALSAGKYISDNVYTEVEATSGGKTSLSINLDVTDNLTAKGKLGSDGDSSLGLFFERDY